MARQVTGLTPLSYVVGDWPGSEIFFQKLDVKYHIMNHDSGFMNHDSGS